MSSGQIRYTGRTHPAPLASGAVGWQLGLLAAHLVLITIAATEFTILTYWSDGRIGLNYFRYFRHSGFGGIYVSAYSLWVVLAYIAAYAVGCAAFWSVKRAGFALLGWAGLILCGLGLVSFAFELTHWFSAHQRSFIASFPIATCGLALLAVASVLYRHFRRPPDVPQG